MKIDFNNLNIKKTNNNIISPKDVFMTLKREEKFQYLWDVQSEVLSKWDKIRNKPQKIKERFPHLLRLFICSQIMILKR